MKNTQNEAYFINGLFVYTPFGLKKRGYCCENQCLHCPYGFTVKSLGLTFKETKNKTYEICLKNIKAGEYDVKSATVKWDSPFDEQDIKFEDVIYWFEKR